MKLFLQMEIMDALLQGITRRIFRAGFNWSKNNNIRVYPDADTDPSNNPTEIQTIESYSQSYNLSFSTNYKTLPNLTLGYNFTVNDNFSDVIYIDSPTLTLEYYFLDAFSSRF